MNPFEQFLHAFRMVGDRLRQWPELGSVPNDAPRNGRRRFEHARQCTVPADGAAVVAEPVVPCNGRRHRDELGGRRQPARESVQQQGRNEGQDDGIPQLGVPGAPQPGGIGRRAIRGAFPQTFDAAPAAVQEEVAVQQQPETPEVGPVDGD